MGFSSPPVTGFMVVVCAVPESSTLSFLHPKALMLTHCARKPVSGALAVSVREFLLRVRHAALTMILTEI